MNASLGGYKHVPRGGGQKSKYRASAELTRSKAISPLLIHVLAVSFLHVPVDKKLVSVQDCLSTVSYCGEGGNKFLRDRRNHQRRITIGYLDPTLEIIRACWHRFALRVVVRLSKQIGRGRSSK